MIEISDIESGIVCISESVGRMPHYAFVSKKSLMNIFKNACNQRLNTGIHGLSAFGVYTSFGLIVLNSMTSVKDDEIIFSQENNLLVDFINKIGIGPHNVTL